MSLKLPPAALLTHIGILGKTGSGKTYAAKTIVEGLLDEGRQVAVIDPTGVWWGLRSGAGGRSGGYEVLILGGPHGDMPLAAGSGGAVATLIAEQGARVICDTSAMTVGERGRWFIDFAGAVFRQVRSPLHLVIDEVHMFAPQGKVPDPEAGRMLHAANTLFSGGRARGLRLLGITQRPAKWHKDSLTSVDTLIAMRMIAPQDRGAVEEWIDGCGDPAKGKEVLGSLAQLHRGEGWVWYPEGGLLERVRFPRIRTFDSSATPTEGEARAAPRLTEIDLEKVRASIQEAAAEADRNDPRALRRRIQELEADLARASAPAAPAPCGQCPGLLGEIGRLRTDRRSLRTAIQGATKAAGELAAALAGIDRALESEPEPATMPAAETPRNNPLRREPAPHAARAGAEGNRAPAPAGKGAGDAPGPHRRILGAIAFWKALRVPGAVVTPTRVQVAAVAGYTASSGTFRNYLAEMRAAGLIVYAGDALDWTDEGAVIGGTSLPVIRSRADLHREVLNRLTGPQQRLLMTLLAGPGGLTRAGLAEATGYEASSGTFRNYLSELRGLALIEYPDPGTVRAAPFLFPDTLR